ncbi:MAG: transporter [Chloroflexi bacterium]|nr:transporter [Chloroflexota bacterium]
MRINVQSPGARLALANGNYRLFLSGQLVSQTCGWMQRLAQAWLVLDLTESPLALGTLTTLQFLPILLLSLIAGALADRLPKRRTLLALQMIAATQSMALAALAATGRVEVWHVYLLALVQGTISAMEQPLRQAFPVELVGRDLIPHAVALNSAAFNTARILGPALAGAAIAWISLTGAFLVNAGSSVVVVALLLRMRIDVVPVAAPSRGLNTFGQIREALGFAAHRPAIVFALGALSWLGIFGFNYMTFMPLLARYGLDLGPSGYGMLSTALGVGALVGALLIARRTSTAPGRMVAGGIAFSGLLAAVGLSPWLATSLALLALLGTAGVLFTTTANTIVQVNAPDAMRGRIMGLYTLLLAGMTPPGAMVTGTLADLWGIRATLTIEAIVCLVGVLAAMRYLATRRPAMAQALAVAH